MGWSDEAIDAWQRGFYACFFLSFAFLLMQRFVDLDTLTYLRGMSWAGAGVCSIQIGRVQHRIGRDGASAVLRGLACFCIAAVVVL